jgi:excisionase family DNA binding protein
VDDRSRPGSDLPDSIPHQHDTDAHNDAHNDTERLSPAEKEFCPAMAAEPRFLTLADVAEVLNISTSQVYALVRNQELDAIKIGGRGQWRVERDRLEAYISRMYDQTRDFLVQHPFSEVGAEDAPGE